MKAKTDTQRPYKKPNSDYYRLDLVKRSTVLNNTTNRRILTESIEKDYREYINGVRGCASITEYIHKLIDTDMVQNKQGKTQTTEIIENLPELSPSQLDIVNEIIKEFANK